jgi:aryl-alcohol dehydrogenase-like predicted oxidoreductase
MSDFAHGPDTITLGDLTVRRLGFGAMRLPGPEVWGAPKDPARAREVLRRAVALGINFVDTSWYYGPHVANRLIAETLHPYAKDLVIATKLGGRRFDDKSWGPFSKPAELREGMEHDLRDLRRDHIDVVHFRFVGPQVPFLDSLGALVDMQREGKLRHIAVSNVSAELVRKALEVTPIVAVQNAFNPAGGAGKAAEMSRSYLDPKGEVLALCEEKRIAFLPYFPLDVGGFAKSHPALDAVAKRTGATPAQVSIAWLLARSPVMLPIPGTSSPEHLEENWGARTVKLTPDDVAAIAREAAAAA